jgi:hypothetical protein
MRNDSAKGTPIPRAVRDIVIVGLCLSCFPISLRIEWCTWRTDVHQPGKVARWHQHSGPDSDAWLYMYRVLWTTPQSTMLLCWKSMLSCIMIVIRSSGIEKRVSSSCAMQDGLMKNNNIGSRSIDLGSIDSSALNHWWTSHCSLSRGFSSWTQLRTQHCFASNVRHYATPDDA